MSKEKEKPFDNSISKTTKKVRCPSCKTNLIFMYARKRTEDEIWLCKECEIIISVKIDILVSTHILKEHNE